MGLDGSGASQVIFRLVVPNANCGSLIGKGGNNIRELREVSQQQNTGSLTVLWRECLTNESSVECV